MTTDDLMKSGQVESVASMQQWIASKVLQMYAFGRIGKHKIEHSGSGGS